ncbi:MAG: hypothetical protein BGO38_14275 [Cellulomonas sp. 73-145]|uniref:hypothetical protein n=1 Tax=Cellulomonas sp. 73-145 TaxID=1895739 RepID=UPI0009284FA3|nr:hypothetical protein [Cellulomonas sp. 73-145]OJV58590.1 MAG: hypothetical protein BGO38_14275 [Cellulomonas sp. 73-145]
MRKLVAISTSAAAVLTVGLLAACDGPPAPPPPTPTFSTHTAEPTHSPTPSPDESTTVPPEPEPEPTPEPPLPTPEPTPEPTTETPVAAGEIWQWALGRNVWSDPDLQPYTQTLGRTWDTDVNVQSLGFQLTPDAAGAVVAVTVYNDENALGYPGTETNFAAYRGTLPLGLTWAHTATDVEQLLGSDQRTGGWGTDITYSYTTTDGFRVEVGFVARHDTDLPGSPIHFVRVSPA